MYSNYATNSMNRLAMVLAATICSFTTISSAVALFALPGVTA